ncbi:kinase-like domain-containing protein [Mycena floridula]|nr:kinase-like domain-containing protein [Mycena floridula]
MYLKHQCFSPFCSSHSFSLPPYAYQHQPPHNDHGKAPTHSRFHWIQAASRRRYLFLDVIASGSLGKVFKAADSFSPCAPFVAIKCIARGKPGSRQEEFLNRELSLHRKVSLHRNDIVALRNQFTTPGFMFLVMDFCDRGDLYTALNQRLFHGNEELIKRIMVQLIDALQYCHRNSVYHRDLKPANVLLGPQGKVYLSDFGMSTESAISEDTGCGTHAYSSPEALGTEINGRPFSTVHSDIWAVGICKSDHRSLPGPGH